MTDMMNRRVLKTALFLPIAMALTTIIYMLAGVQGHTWNAAVLNNFVLLSMGLLTLAFILAFRANSKHAHNLCYVLLGVTVLGFFWTTLLGFPGTGSRLGNQGREIFVYTAFASCALIAWIMRADFLYLVGAIILAIPITLLTIYLMVTIPLTSALKSIELSKTCVVQLQFDQYGHVQNLHRVQTQNDYKLGWRISEHTPRIVKYSNTDHSFWSYSAGEFGYRDIFNQTPERCPAGYTS
jgi:hypothetical protein